MHETMVAKNVLDTILKEAEKLGAKPLSAVISCGQLNPINDEVLDTAFQLAAENTVCSDMKLSVKHIPLKSDCNNCKQTFDFDIYSPFCPNCKSSDFQIAPDAPLMLEEIEFEDPAK